MLVGLVSNIQKFSLHDGPGIRSTVFLKGCNMRCTWCHNPEAISATPQSMFFENRCIGCGLCGPQRTDAAACPTGALELVGRRMTVEEVVFEVSSDLPYYQESGGGLTLSGGEPLLQVDFAEALLRVCRELGMDTAIETNLSLPFSTLEPLLPWLNLIYCDLKLMDDQAHQKLTGVSNRTVLENLRLLDARDVPFVVRTPLIPGITDGEENITAIAAWLYAYAPPQQYELLNYNPLAEAKHRQAGAAYLPGRQKPLSRARVAMLAELAEQQGVEVLYGQE